jgi:carbon monoxide dehydrogenase subunit G
VILATPLEAAWAALSALPPARGRASVYTGVARLVEADDDTHTATLRLYGTGPFGPVRATVTATLEPVAAGTRLHVSTHATPPADAAMIQAMAERLAEAIAPGAREVAPAPREVAPERGRPRTPGRLVSAALHRMRRT